MIPVGRQHEYLVLGPPAGPGIYQATTFSVGAALAMVTWDALLTLDDEVDHIWSRPGRACIKWIYLFSRWFGLLNQIGIQIWHSVLINYFPVPLSTCEAFFVYQAVTFQLLQICLDAVMTFRLWAIYQRHRRYVAAAIFLVFLEVLASIVTQATAVPQSVVDGTCAVIHAAESISTLGIVIIVSQTVLWSLTYRGKFRMPPAVRRSRIVNIAVRDGSFVFCVVIVILVLSTIYIRFNVVIVNVFFPWMPVVLSILTPRMILNMQTAVEPTESALEFTTDLGCAPGNEMSVCEAETEAEHAPAPFVDERLTRVV